MFKEVGLHAQNMITILNKRGKEDPLWSFNEHGNDLHFERWTRYSYNLQNLQGKVAMYLDMDVLTILY